MKFWGVQRRGGGSSGGGGGFGVWGLQGKGFWGQKQKQNKKKMKSKMRKKKKKKKKREEKRKKQKKKKQSKHHLFDFGQFRLRPISTSANFDFGQVAEVELAEVELAEVEHPHQFWQPSAETRLPAVVQTPPTRSVSGASPSVLEIRKRCNS